MEKMRDLRQVLVTVYNRFALKANRGTIGIGLIGIGGWGASNAVSIMRCQRFNILGVYDIETQFARRFAGRYNTKCYSQFDDLLNDSDVQAIAVTVPNQFHADVVKAAADAGKHIFVEKPLASHPDVCRELGQYCRERQVILQIGHQMRREPVFREMKHILGSGVLGQPLYAQAVYTLDRQSRDDWRQDADLCLGGSMEQLGVHLIDVLIYLFGLPKHTQGWAENTPRCLDAPDWAHVSMSFAHNLHASVSTSFSTPRHMRLEVFFDGGHLVTDGQVLWTSHDGLNVEKVKPKGLTGSVAQFIEFANCIKHGHKPETGMAEAVAVMEVVCSVYSETEIAP
ncbi:MAG: Gfo/Idh/MocA family oxidoreductase [Chloroflexi bacterium]|nr:Gfo/Idh/MocA family oxidoreductase [Chloroflexota bacterium]